MIIRCRPDPDLDTFCSLLNATQANVEMHALVDRQLHSTPSGRDGLLWFLRAMEIGAGDEVALPALICEVVADAIIAAGAKPVVFGNDPVDFSPSLAYCRAAIGSDTKAVVVPHLYGIPADLVGFAELCRERKMLLIEDCAPCVRGIADGCRVGSVGDAAIFSFSYDKPLSLGWGGALTLSPMLEAALPPTTFPLMTEADDRLLAAAFIVQHLLTDAAVYEQFLPVNYALSQLVQQREYVEEVLEIVEGGETSDALPLWCQRKMRRPKEIYPSFFSRAKRLAARGLSRALQLYNSCSTTDPARTALGNVALARNGLAMRLLAAQDTLTQECHGWEHRQRIAHIYLDGLDRKRLVVPSPPRPPACWLRFPVAWRCNAQERDRRCREIGDALKVEIGPYNWRTPVHLVPRRRSMTRVGPGTEETEALIEGLFNLPVHLQMSETLAAELVERINVAAT